MRQVVPLDEADAMLASDGAFHLDGALHHPVHHIFGRLSLRLVEDEDTWLLC